MQIVRLECTELKLYCILQLNCLTFLVVALWCFSKPTIKMVHLFRVGIVSSSEFFGHKNLAVRGKCAHPSYTIWISRAVSSVVAREVFVFAMFLGEERGRIITAIRVFGRECQPWPICEYNNNEFSGVVCKVTQSVWCVLCVYSYNCSWSKTFAAQALPRARSLTLLDWYLWVLFPVVFGSIVLLNFSKGCVLCADF